MRDSLLLSVWNAWCRHSSEPGDYRIGQFLGRRNRFDQQTDFAGQGCGGASMQPVTPSRNNQKTQRILDLRSETLLRVAGTVAARPCSIVFQFRNGHWITDAGNGQGTKAATDCALEFQGRTFCRYQYRSADFDRPVADSRKDGLAEVDFAFRFIEAFRIRLFVERMRRHRIRRAFADRIGRLDNERIRIKRYQQRIIGTNRTGAERTAFGDLGGM